MKKKKSSLSLNREQQHATSSHTREAICQQPEAGPSGSNPPNERKKSRLSRALERLSNALKRRCTTSTATKSDDRVRNANRNSRTLDWVAVLSTDKQDLQAEEVSSLEWRIGWTKGHHSSDATRNKQKTVQRFKEAYRRAGKPKKKSKIKKFVKRLNPWMRRPGSSKVSLRSLQSPHRVPARIVYPMESLKEGLDRLVLQTKLQEQMAGSSAMFQVTKAKTAKDDARQRHVPPPRIFVQEPEAECSVHVHEAVVENRGDENWRAKEQQQPCGDDVDLVVGLPECGDVADDDVFVEDNSCVGTQTPRSSLPGTSGVRDHHKIRAQSLIIPSHHRYAFLDLRPKLITVNKSSQESIGVCSLDINRSSTERSESNVQSASEKTLKSLNLSCNEEPVSLPVDLKGYVPFTSIFTGHSECTTNKNLKTGDASSSDHKPKEILSVPTHQPSKKQPISPLGSSFIVSLTNGTKECKVERYVESRSSSKDFSEVDKDVSLITPCADIHMFPEISPLRRKAVIKKRRKSPMTSTSQQNKSFVTDISTTVEVKSQELNASPNTVKSLIQERAERLYGPGALAQGFFKRITARSNASDSSLDKSRVNFQSKNPEPRIQLPVLRSRKPIDYSDQIPINRPLRRLTPVRTKDSKDQTDSTTTNSHNNVTKTMPFIEGVILKRDILPDQEPAAPKVKPVEPNDSSTNIVKQAEEAEKVIQEKDGHYFMKLLKQETERLLSLAASAEAELASGDTAALPEEAAGKLRSAAGQAKLLTSRKMQQFEGLCKKNINQRPDDEFPATNEDLAGFWDMVMLQIVQVNELFDQIEKLRISQWQDITPDKKTASTSQNGKRRVMPVHKAKPIANNEANKKAREAREQARRQIIEERRRAIRSNAQSADDSVEIFAPKT